MALVIADMSMSLDGFVADPHGDVQHVFAWMRKQQPAAEPLPKRSGLISSADAVDIGRDSPAGALVCGRDLFDLAQGWGGRHPVGVHVYVVTHHPPPGWSHPEWFTFVTDGVDGAVTRAKETAGDRIVGVASPSIAQQCLDAGLLDGLRISLVPVLLGEGIPLFGRLSRIVQLGDPRIVPGNGVTHLHYNIAHS